MATIARRLVLCARRHPIPTAPRYTPLSAIPWQRRLSTTVPRHNEDPKDDSRDKKIEEYIKGIELDGDIQDESGDKSVRRFLEALSEVPPKALLKELDAIPESEEDPENLTIEEKKDLGILDEDAISDEEEYNMITQAPEPRQNNNFWDAGEDEHLGDEDYFGDDISALGHGELEQHRELREYARLAAWELPLLSKLAKPFEPPSASQPLRFRYTTYLGEEHPAAKKVVVEFCTSDMPNLTQLQKDKLIKMAGPRYNPSTDIVKMSCEMFGTQAQNKRYLRETINNLLKEAREGKDTFADVPFDFRHHKPKMRVEFPKEWILTPDRKQYLESKRKQQLELDAGRMASGNLLDGAKLVEKVLSSQMQVPVPEMVEAARGKQRLR